MANPQAFAMRCARDPLCCQINRAIVDMVNDGTTAHLIETYLRVPASSRRGGYAWQRGQRPSPRSRRHRPPPVFDGMAWGPT